jgi:hypothetical protein
MGKKNETAETGMIPVAGRLYDEYIEELRKGDLIALADIKPSATCASA